MNLSDLQMTLGLKSMIHQLCWKQHHVHQRRLGNKLFFDFWCTWRVRSHNTEVYRKEADTTSVFYLTFTTHGITEFLPLELYIIRSSASPPGQKQKTCKIKASKSSTYLDLNHLSSQLNIWKTPPHNWTRSKSRTDKKCCHLVCC